MPTCDLGNLSQTKVEARARSRFLQRKHMFSLRSRARRSFGVPSPSMGVEDRRVDCRSCRDPFARFRTAARDEKNPRSFRAASLSSRAWAQVRVRCSFMGMKESTASVPLRNSSPICAIQLAAIVSSRGRQCSSSYSPDCSSGSCVSSSHG